METGQIPPSIFQNNAMHAVLPSSIVPALPPIFGRRSLSSQTRRRTATLSILSKGTNQPPPQRYRSVPPGGRTRGKPAPARVSLCIFFPRGEKDPDGHSRKILRKFPARVLGSVQFGPGPAACLTHSCPNSQQPPTSTTNPDEPTQSLAATTLAAVKKARTTSAGGRLQAWGRLFSTAPPAPASSRVSSTLLFRRLGNRFHASSFLLLKGGLAWTRGDEDAGREGRAFGLGYYGRMASWKLLISPAAKLHVPTSRRPATGVDGNAL